MADFGLAAQIGRGNAMPGAQQQDPQNRMMQMMQLQQLQQNMMLAREQEGRAAGLYGLQRGTLEETLNNLRKSEERAVGAYVPELERKQTESEIAKLQRRTQSVQTNLTEEGYNLKTRLLKLRSTTEPDVMMSPDFRKALMRSDPELATEIDNLAASGEKTRAEIQKAGYDRDTAKLAQQKAIVGSIANSLGGVVDQQTFSTVLNELEKVDPLATKLIGPRFNAESMRKLERRLRGLQNFELKQNERGEFERIDLDTGTATVVGRASPFGSTALTEPTLGANADAATFNAARAMGAAVPSYTPPGAAPIIGDREAPAAQGLSPKAAVAGEKKTAELQAADTVAGEARKKGVGEVLKALDNPEIEKLIRRSTSGIVERGFAAIPRALGQSTSGMEAIGQLDTIAGDLTLRLLNGKLGAGISNADVELIKNTLADIGNSLKPANERLAAYRQLKKNLESVVSGKPIEVVPGSANADAVDKSNPLLGDMPFGGRR